MSVAAFLLLWRNGWLSHCRLVVTLFLRCGFLLRPHRLVERLRGAYVAMNIADSLYQYDVDLLQPALTLKSRRNGRFSVGSG